VGVAVLALPVAAFALWAPDAGGDGPRSGPVPEKRIMPVPRKSPSKLPEEKKRVPPRLGEAIYEDSFDKPDLNEFWTERSPATKPGYVCARIGNSRLCMAVARKADGQPAAYRGKYLLHPRVEIVSRSIALGKDGVAFDGKMFLDPWMGGSWEWGCEYLAEDGRPIARCIVPGKKTVMYEIGGERFGPGKPRKGRTLVVTPHGEVWLCEGLNLSRIVVRKRLREKVTSIRLRLFAAIPEKSAKGGWAMAVWDRVGVHRVHLGSEKPSASDMPQP
jgi:hypothetical protein